MTIQKGSEVKIHYTLTVEGAVVDSSDGKDPLAFVQGSGQIIPGLDNELLGLAAGAKKTVTVQADQAYGARNPEAIQKVPKEAFNEADKLKVGEIVQGEAQGQQFQATIAAIDEKEVTLDYNHPLADKVLEFSVEVVEVNNP